MHVINHNYEQSQKTRERLADLAKYMSWRVLPRDMKHSLRRYLNFVYHVSAHMGEVEKEVMSTLSTSLQSKLCGHIYGNILSDCPFLAWMHHDREAMKKLCLRVKTLFLEANDLMFNFGELNSSVYMLIKGWVTLCMGARFDTGKDRDEVDLFKIDLTGSARVATKTSTDDGFLNDVRMKALEAKHTATKIDVIEKMKSRRYTAMRKQTSKFGDPTAKSFEDREYAYIPAPAFFGESLPGLFIGPLAWGGWVVGRGSTPANWCQTRN